MFVWNRRHTRLQKVLDRSRVASRPSQDASTDADRRKAIQAKLREVEDKRAGRKRFRLATALAQAGIAWTPSQFIAAALASGLVLALVGLAISPIAAVLGLVAGALGLPHLVLKICAKRRLTRFIGLFAETLDIIIRGVRSGLPLGECMHIIARDVPDPVGGEFRQVTEGVRLGLTMEEALQRMSERVPTPEVRFFAIVIGIQQQTGGNLAETLAKLADVLRSRKRMRDKVRAVSGEAKASATIIGSLPVVIAGLIGVVSPEYIKLLFTTSIGNWIIAGGLVTMTVGIFVMRSMINFDI